MGICFNWNGSFGKAKKLLHDKASKAMYSLIQKGRRLNVPTAIMLTLFDSCVEPILLYGCEIWGYENVDIKKVASTNSIRSCTHFYITFSVNMYTCHPGLDMLVAFFQNNGSNYAWLTQDCNIDANIIFKSECDQFKQLWHSKIINKENDQNLTHFKLSHEK